MAKLIQGMMRLRDLNVCDVESLIKFDIERGINYFDTSSIYLDGDSERKIGEVLKNNPDLREKIIIQTKCGIYKERSIGVNYYDLSYEAIIKSVNDSLERLNTSYVDYLLLHRPDIFIDNKEVAKAFNELYKENKVKHFGVSNFSKELMKYLDEEVVQKLEVNQLQLGIGHPLMIESVFNLNTNFDEGISRDGDLYFYLKRKNINLQCWSPFQYGMFEGTIFSNNERFKPLQDELQKLASKYHTSSAAIAISFLTSLGENVSVVLGTTNKEHILDAIAGAKIVLDKKEWYGLYTKAGFKLP